MKKISILMPIFLIPYLLFSQDNIHEEVNKSVYNVFSTAYEASDAKLYQSIHSKKLLRITSGGEKIRDYDEYLGNLEEEWKDRKGVKIDFRIFERINTTVTVSDRGVYRVTYNAGTSSARNNYGIFHTVIMLEEGKWRFIVDYDEPANKEDFDAAHPLEKTDSYTMK